ncbi:efflux RND transporter periplasmic adaptor subunit [Desulfosediminicola flagellatus]|uniref:efflux RND transporter periplasmic adaptor subunit n=1 Tax=Desulfosediminicola flagellatus TaxID=2569541 RepID=UPI0010ACC119|nr:efflux RND transporter periplasmic adaptor subunit [Desulfosediminicola flagellatus]
MKLYWLIATAISISLVISGCENHENGTSQTPQLTEVTVTAQKAEQVSVSNPIEILGTVQSAHRAEIAAKVTGAISELPVMLGSVVRKGDLLVKISAGEIDAQLRKSRAQLNQASRNLEREKKLLKKNAATPETVRSYEDSLAIAEAAYEEAQTLQGYTQILAPFNGLVARKEANVGDMATPGKPLLYIEDDKQLQVITDIPEAMISELRVGDQLSITIPSAAVTTTGTIAEIAPIANPTTRTGAVKLNISHEENLRSGQFARVSLLQKGAGTIIIPHDAIRISGQMEQLFVVEDDKARLRLVRSGTTYDDGIEILSGVKPGDLIITKGQDTVKDGQPVKLH